MLFLGGTSTHVYLIIKRNISLTFDSRTLEKRNREKYDV